MTESGPISSRERCKAVSLLSGGLDSQLAVCLLKDQGIDVLALVFESPFFDSVHARDAAERLGVPLRVADFTSDIMRLIETPKHGFGAGMNPCIDCHTLMLRRAGELMEELRFHFICTGEVLNQRPMSQNPDALKLVARESGYEDFTVRPLSAKLLPETIPERNGWINRGKLLDIRGRSREVQLRLAQQYGLRNFPSPAGGCRLTDPNFARRLHDLKEHEGFNGIRSINLLRAGRHFRLADNVKFIVGRDQKDNLQLEGATELYDLVLKVENEPSPTGLLPFTARDEQILQAAAICARYSDCSPDKPAVVRVRSARGLRRIETMPATQEEIEKLRI